MSALLTLSGVHKSFPRGDRVRRVLSDVNLTADAGELVAVVGGKGEGKSTLLRLASGLLVPDEGEVGFAGHDLRRCADDERSKLLREDIAWTEGGGPRVRLTVRDHVALPLMLGHRSTRRNAARRAMSALERVGAAECASRFWEELSNWERALVELARTIAREPRMLVLDGLLDGFGMRGTEELGDLLLSIVDELGCAALLATSDVEPSVIAQSVYTLEGGALRRLSGAGGRTADVIDFPQGERAHRASGAAGV